MVLAKKPRPKLTEFVCDHRVFRHQRAKRGSDGIRRERTASGFGPHAVVRRRDFRTVQRIDQASQRLNNILFRTSQGMNFGIVRDRGLHRVRIGEEGNGFAGAHQDKMFRPRHRPYGNIDDIGHTLQRQTPLSTRHARIRTLRDNAAARGGLNTMG